MNGMQEMSKSGHKFGQPGSNGRSLSGKARCLAIVLMATLAFPVLAMNHAHAQSSRKAISKDAPAFPSDALDEGITSGSVKVRLSVAADGSVSKVDILEATPKGVFDKAVMRTLARWKYEPGAAETIETLVSFKDR